jgi:large subunit ribosomal protein L15
MPEELNLSNLKPASPRKDRKRIGRGMGSGKGRYAGRGIKGQKARSGSNKMRAGFEGGQMPIYMRLGKQRGPYSKDAMPMGPHRTQTAAVNLRELDRFDEGSEVTPESLSERGLIRSTRLDVKILGHGELKKKLSVTAHYFSASAREKIEAAGGSVTQLKEPKERKQRRRPAPPEQAADEPAEAPEPEPEAEAETEEPAAE